MEYLYEIAKVLDPKSQARKLAAIKQFFNYMVLGNYLEIHPAEAIENPKYSRKIPDTLSSDEIDSLIEHIDFPKHKPTEIKLLSNASTHVASV